MKKIYKYLIIAGILLVLFTVWSILVVNDIVDPMDEAIVEAIVSFRGEKGGFWYWLVRTTTEFAYIFVVIPIALVVIILYKGNLRSLSLAGGMGVMKVTNSVVKKMICRERPNPLYHWMTENSYSYPSGHTTSAVVCYGLLAYIIYRSNLKKSLKYSLIGIQCFIILWVGFTRMVLSVHFFSDIIGGLLSGSLLVVLVIALCEFLESKGFDGLPTIITKIKEKKAK